VPEQASAISIEPAWILAGQIECRPGLRRGKQLKCALLRPIKLADD
jgi:hypothetical protein